MDINTNKTPIYMDDSSSGLSTENSSGNPAEEKAGGRISVISPEKVLNYVTLPDGHEPTGNDEGSQLIDVHYSASYDDKYSAFAEVYGTPALTIQLKNGWKAFCYESGIVNLWNLRDPKLGNQLVATLEGHDKVVGSVELLTDVQLVTRSNDGTKLVTRSNDGTKKIWKI